MAKTKNAISKITHTADFSAITIDCGGKKVERKISDFLKTHAEALVYAYTVKLTRATAKPEGTSLAEKQQALWDSLKLLDDGYWNSPTRTRSVKSEKKPEDLLREELTAVLPNALKKTEAWVGVFLEKKNYAELVWISKLEQVAPALEEYRTANAEIDTEALLAELEGEDEE